MHEFPDHITLAFPVRKFILDITIIVIYLSALRLILRSQDRVYQPKITLIFITALITTILLAFSGFHEKSWYFKAPYDSTFFTFLTWIIATYFTLKCISQFYSTNNQQMLVESSKDLILIGFPFFALIFGILILVPISTCHNRVADRRTSCLNNMRNVGIAVQNYATHHRGRTPPTAAGNPPRSWRVEILPYLDHGITRQNYNNSLKWNKGENQDIAKLKMEFYQCPQNPHSITEEGYQLTAFAAITGANALWHRTRSGNLETTSKGDGLSQTLMLVEACGQIIAWSEPRDVDIDSMPIGFNLPGNEPGRSKGVISSYHQWGANVIFGDSSGRHLSTKTDPEILKKLCTATGGETLTQFDF